MGNRVNKTVSIDAETARKIGELGKETHRTDGRVIDWLVEEAWNRIEEVHRKEEVVASVTSDDAVPCDQLSANSAI